jgi:hypothetical protein
MSLKLKIALYEPCIGDSDRYFSFKLKQDHHTEPSEYRPSQKVLIIGGIQGRFQNFRNVLLQNGVIDEGYRWTFGSGHLVIAGNCMGENEIGIECLWLIYALENRARVRGGYIHFILGRNELNNFHGNWQYRHPKYAHTPETFRSPYVILYDGNLELKRWLKTKNVIEKIGELLISHADLSNDLSPFNSFPAKINNTVRQHLSKPAELNTLPIVAPILHLNDLGIYNALTAQKYQGLTYVFTGSDNINDPENSTDTLLFRNNRFYRRDLKGKRIKISFDTLV